jgi:hypothetical protein
LRRGSPGRESLSFNTAASSSHRAASDRGDLRHPPAPQLLLKKGVVLSTDVLVAPKPPVSATQFATGLGARTSRICGSASGIALTAGPRATASRASLLARRSPVAKMATQGRRVEVAVCSGAAARVVPCVFRSQKATTLLRPAVSPMPGIADPPAVAQDPVRPIDVAGTAEDVAHGLHRLPVPVDELPDVLVGRPAADWDGGADPSDLLEAHRTGCTLLGRHDVLDRCESCKARASRTPGDAAHSSTQRLRGLRAHNVGTCRASTGILSAAEPLQPG